MITREDLDRAEQCTASADCPVHRIGEVHHPLAGLDVEANLWELIDIVEALEPAISESWDGETSFGDIAARWIAHMASTHGAHCAGPHCEATADTPAYVGALRRMWHETETTDHPEWCVDKRETLSDLAHELGVDLEPPGDDGRGSAPSADPADA